MNDTKTFFWKSNIEAIICIVIVLLGIGCINVFSASQVAAEEMFSNSKHYLYRYLIYALAGFIVTFILTKVDYHFWLRNADIISILTIVLLVFVVFKGTNINGARRWIQFGSFFSFQPSELAKMVVIILCSSYLSKRFSYKRKANLFSLPLFLTLIMGFLVYIQPDLGTAAIIVALAVALYFICGLPTAQYMLLLTSVPIAVIVLATKASYRAERLQAWLNPWAYADRAGYQTVQSLMAIGSGGLTGMGAGSGSSKFFYLPEAHTDFSFAVFCQEWGFIGALIVIILFIFLSYILYRSANLTCDGGGYLLITGTNLFITGQALANMAMVSGLLPVIGVPLPFISYGGTALLINMALLGIVINVIKKSSAKPMMKPSPGKNTKNRQLYLIKG